MAVTVASTGIGDGTGGNVTVTKPTGLSEGDMMIAGVAAEADGTGSNSWATPSGWTAIASGGYSNQTIFACFGKIATAGDVAASNFTFEGSGTMNSSLGVILRMTSDNGFASIASNIAGQGAHVNTNTLTSSGITTKSSSGVLLIFIASEKIDGDVNFAGYAVTNNNPSWTEQQDLYYEPGGVAINLGVASATYNLQQATGVWQATTTTSEASGAIVSIHENINVAVTGNTGIINLVGNEGTPAAGANVTGTTGVINLVGNEGTTTLSDNKWSNVDKSSAPSWNNVDKS